MSFFSFLKDSMRRKTWTIYCRRDEFVPENHSRLCPTNFSKDQLERDPNVLNDFDTLMPELDRKKMQFPMSPFVLQEAASLALPLKTQGAFAKRSKPYSNEVKRSAHMKLEGLKMGIKQLEDAGLQIDNIITVRQGMVRVFMRTEHIQKPLL